MPTTLGLMACDLHVHSLHSAETTRVAGGLARECYSHPEDVYERARARGMHLVTLTDHDTIAGAMALAHHDDTFVSEEVTCVLPGGRELHLGVFDLTDAHHQAITRRRRDAEALFAYLAEERLPTCVNHPFSALTGARETEDLMFAFARASLVETRNGMLSAACNDAATWAARSRGRRGCGGSDAHTLASVAAAFTLVAAASKADYLEGLRGGLTLAAGRSGRYALLVADIARLLLAGCADPGSPTAVRAARFALALVAVPLLPLATLGAYANEQAFVARHLRRFRALSRPGPYGSAPAGALP